MITFMEDLPRQLEKPEAILVISAHWEEGVPTVIASDNPPLFYDYYGFPQQAYAITYPAPGNPVLADKIINMLGRNEIESKKDNSRGFDHGLYIPLKMMYPKADIPVTQLSLVKGLDPNLHIEIGKALMELANEKLLIIGSGFSFHNMKAFDWKGRNVRDPMNEEFQDWLIDVCTGNYNQTDREEKLVEWEASPFARYCHPREEHLMPIHVCSGIAGGKGKKIFDDYILGKRAIAIRW
jgi:aromatic ring-opening dioxygenase catalytic subunit (LigB family)